MKIFIYLALVALAASAPASKEVSSEISDDNVTVTEEFYDSNFKIYTSENDIIKIHFPVNALNMGDDNDEEETEDRVIFFVEVDEDSVPKGVSVLINDKPTLLLPTGTSVTSGVEDTKVAYIGATDGIYVYNATLNKAVKYGTLTDSISEIVQLKGTEDVFYILTMFNKVYKVTEKATKKELVAVANGATDISVDKEGNFYFINKEKELKVLNAEGVVVPVAGFPTGDLMALIQPAFLMESSIVAIVDNRSYFVYSNGTYEYASVNFVDGEEPSAVSIEGTLMIYMAKNKSIYEYNVLAIIMGEEILNELKSFLDGKSNAIEELSTKSRSDIS